MQETEYLEDSKAYIDKLRNIPTLSPFTKKNLEGLIRLSKIRKYQPEEVILEEGGFDKWIYFLISGKVQVIKAGKTISTLQRTGDIFGEMGIIDGSARSATIQALDETVCLATDASDINELSGNDQLAFGYILYRVFSEILANRLRVTSEELVKAKEK
ncbi:MAG TPA: cyclic nucleotide-binding domain-containing protein [Deltaproteobacteria bacterium]|nr:cyclic nucleotide-binding domain-containing protein [Deltaproteobacteria bacterium]